MTICDDLRQSVLQAAIQGRLTKQLPEDGSAADLLASIKAEKEQLIKEKKIKKEKPLPPIRDEEIPFDIPDNWDIVRLGELISIKSGDSLTSKEFIPGNIPVYGGNGITGYHNASNVEKGTILIGRVGFYCGCIHITESDAWATDNALIVRYDKCFDQRYLVLLLKALDLGHSTNQTAQPVVTGKIIRPIIAPIPPLAEQHRIVARVDELMAKIDELETVENELVALKKAFPGDMKASLLQAAMQGKLTQQLPEDGSAEDLLASIKFEKDKLIAEKKIKKDSIEALEDVPFDIPTSWCWVRLNDIVVKTVKRGKSPTYTTKSNTLVFAQKCNTKAGYINMELALFLDEGKLNKYPDDEFMQDMDIVINSTGNGTLGRVGFFRNTDNPRGLRIVPDSHVTVIRPSSQMNAAYAMYCMKYYQPYFEKTCTGSTNQTELSVDTLKNLAFPLPPLAEQKRIVEKLDKLLPLCDALKEDGVA